jgi:transposase InsO family protein
VPTGPKQLWVADITYIAIAVGFVYLAAILDAWSRRVVGYAIVRRIDARSTTAGGSNRHSDTGAPIRFEQEHARQMVKFEV